MRISREILNFVAEPSTCTSSKVGLTFRCCSPKAQGAKKPLPCPCGPLGPGMLTLSSVLCCLRATHEVLCPEQQAACLVLNVPFLFRPSEARELRVGRSADIPSRGRARPASLAIDIGMARGAAAVRILFPCFPSQVAPLTMCSAEDNSVLEGETEVRPASRDSFRAEPQALEKILSAPFKL